MTIRVNAIASDHSRYSDESGPFAIRAGGIYIARPRRQWPGILEPGREEEIYYISHSLPIRWHVKPHSLGRQSAEFFLLDRDGTAAHHIGGEDTGANGVGHRTWEIGRPALDRPEVLTASLGPEHRIRVEQESDSSVYDDSVRFTIASPTVSVATPQRPPDRLLSSDEFFRDESIDIHWTTEHLRAGQPVAVVATVENYECDRGGHPLPTSKLVAMDVPATSGHVSWDIGDAIAALGYTLWPIYEEACYPLDLRFRVQLQNYEQHIFGESQEVVEIIYR